MYIDIVALNGPGYSVCFGEQNQRERQCEYKRQNLRLIKIIQIDESVEVLRGLACLVSLSWQNNENQNAVNGLLNQIFMAGVEEGRKQAVETLRTFVETQHSQPGEETK